MSINKSPSRVGFFTSSQIGRLCGFDRTGKNPSVGFMTYVQEVQMERDMGLPINDESQAKNLIWGKLIESRVNNLLPSDYSVSSQETDVNPEIPDHSGSKDGLRHSEKKAVLEIKCPRTRKSFYNAVIGMGECEDVKYLDRIIRYAKNGKYAIDNLRKNHKDGEDWYFQIVSNGVINGLDFGELVVYCPFQSELQEIRDEAQNYNGDIPLSALYWIGNNTNDDELVYINKGGKFNNLNIIRFEIPQEDKDFLIDRIKLAGSYLV